MNRIKTIVKIIICLGVVYMAITSLGEMMTYSKYIDETAETLIADYNDQNAYLYSSASTMENEMSINYGALNGNVRLGTLVAAKETAIHIQTETKKRNLKLLLMNDTTEEVIFFDFVPTTELDISIETGTYQVYLVGNWFFGKYSMAFSGASFET